MESERLVPGLCGSEGGSGRTDSSGRRAICWKCRRPIYESTESLMWLHEGMTFHAAKPMDGTIDNQEDIG